MATFGASAVAKNTKIGDALPGRVNAFCSCIRETSHVTNARCNGSLSFQEVEIALVCP